MTAYSPEVRDHIAQSDGTVDRRLQAVAGAVCGYRIDVVASSVEDLVRSAGGWLFDRISQGWTVNASMTAPGDFRALQILGIRTASTRIDPGADIDVPSPLAAGAEPFVSDARVRGSIVAAFTRGEAEVTLWGDSLPRRLNRNVKTVEHRLSAAARMFKAQALLAASIPHEAVSPTESLCIYAGSSQLGVISISSDGPNVTQHS
jgi:hypothetical protein